MKLKAREKGIGDVKDNGKSVRKALNTGVLDRPHVSQETKDREMLAMLNRMEAARAARANAAVTSPLTAWEAGVGYQGPDMPDKGDKNGSCNVTACQMPLAGRPQFWMVRYGIENGRNYYCSKCRDNMDEWDAVMVARGENKPNTMGLNQYGYRCSPDEDNAELHRVAV